VSGADRRRRRVIARTASCPALAWHAARMLRDLALIVRRLAALGLVAVVVAGCVAPPSAAYDNQPPARRCDRNGDIDERRAC
jgi:anti-sigma factor RsiW